MKHSPLPPRPRIALVGLGDIAQKAYLPLLTAHPRVKPVLCTRDEGILARLATTYRVGEAYTELDALIAARPDAAMVHAATAAHRSVASALLGAGIPTFVDKPLADNFSDAAALVALAERSDLPLYVGFNRRHAPLIAPLRTVSDPLYVSWEKNRVALPADARTFVFDDFVHVVDGLRFLGGEAPVRDLDVAAHSRDGQLEAVYVHWRQGATVLTGGMNRVAGRTEERVRYLAPGATHEIDELERGTRAVGGVVEPLGFGNWTPTLEKRGFVAMVDDWLAAVGRGGFDADHAAGALESHRLCEEIVGRLAQADRSV